MNSSIFNSRNCRAALSLPLRTHTWHCAIFLGAIFLIKIASHYLPLLYPPPGSPLDGINTKEIAVLVLGNSQMLGVKSEYLSEPTLNAAEGGADYAMLFAITSTLSSDLPKLKTVLLQVDNIPLRQDAMGNRNGDFNDLARWGVSWWDLPNVSFLQRAIYGISYQTLLRPIFVGPKLEQPELDKKIAPHMSGKLVTEWFLGAAHAFSTNNSVTSDDRKTEDQVWTGFEYAPSEGRRKMETYLRTLNKSSTAQLNADYFRKIVELSESKGWRVVLVRTPTTCDFWRTRPAQWDDELHDLIETAVEAFPSRNPIIWDLERTAEFPTSLFYDPNHTNPDGSFKFSKIIDNRLKLLNAGGLTVPKPLNPNSSFEEGDLSGWVGGDLEISSETSRSGEKSMVIHTGESTWGGVYYGATGFFKCDMSTFPCKPNTAYLASTWVKGLDNFEGVSFQIHAFQDRDNNFGKASVELGEKWRRVTWPFITGPNTNHLGFMLSKLDNNSPAIVAVDDFEVLETFLPGDPE